MATIERGTICKISYSNTHYVVDFSSSYSIIHFGFTLCNITLLCRISRFMHINKGSTKLGHCTLRGMGT
jgi:hypothetical protein